MPAPKIQIDPKQVAFDDQVRRAVENCKTKIVGILGRKPCAALRIGSTSKGLPKPEGQPAKGYTVFGLFSSQDPKVIDAIERHIVPWVVACHAARYEKSPTGAVPMPEGQTSLYLATR